MSKAREFIDFWIENSVHAAEPFRTIGASGRCRTYQTLYPGCKGSGPLKNDLQIETGDLRAYIENTLKDANKAESEKRGPK